MGPGKGQAKSVSVAKAKRNQRKQAKTEEKLVNVSSGDDTGSSGEENSIKNKQTATRPPLSQSGKRQRIINEEAMDKDFANSTSSHQTSPSRSEERRVG